MEDHGTAFPDWYITFQQAALAALPRPPRIDQDTALGWADNHEAMKSIFLQALIPPGDSVPTPKEPKTILSIDRVHPFNPAEFIGKGWSIWRGPEGGDGLSGDEEQDEHSLALIEICPATILLETGLDGGKKEITGEERILRLKAAGRIRLDAAIFHSLWRNQHLIPEEWKKKINGYTAYIFFDGTTLRSPDGDRCALYLCFDDGGWDWDYHWLDCGRHVRSPSAVLASI